MRINYPVLLFFLLLCTAAGCGSGKNVSTDYPEPSVSEAGRLDVSQLVGKRPVTLAELVDYSASQQYSSPETIYNRPPEDMTHDYYVLLSRTNEVVNLADRVISYVQHGNVLAVGFQSGIINIYGGPGCGAVQTETSPVTGISWFPDSRVLAATSGEGKYVEVFRVDECARVRMANVNSTVDLFAISPKGSWLAIVDEARRLFVGPAEGRLRQVYRFLHKPLSLSFSGGEGILMAVDETGQLNMWSPLKLSRIFEYKIKGGPFREVRADGPYLNIITEKGDRFLWDVSSKARSAYQVGDDRFSLKNGVLSYTSPRKRFSRKVVFSPVRISVERSGSGGVFRIKDVDGNFRFYSEKSGDLIKDAPDLADWKKVRVDSNYRFTDGGREFVLADPIAQREFQRLYCRYIPSKGYVLWWEKVARPDDYFKSRGMIPRREGISARAPLKWIPLASGESDIRD
ncbi:WD40 repeat domain-containing protein [Maridesulfovibrio sp.]|uniref:WD40 repeat domain-containing protein n=1 Tax=Maridesulfovibrio sp. TaxID=2795000 RepID=UPI002A18E705|nr:WD40 repeat domain-containing protein [Maridesulfovibrio sp.]